MFEARIDPDRGVIWLSGELDLAVAEDFPAKAATSLDRQRDLVVDLSGLTFLDSSGVRALVDVARRCNRQVVLRSPRANVRKIIAITGIVGHLGIRLEE